MKNMVLEANRANRAPVANAGSDISTKLTTNFLLLNGSNSYDSDSDSVAYSWQQLSGPTTVSIKDSKLAISSVSNIGIGTYQFQLKVSDPLGLFNVDTVEYVALDPCESIAGGSSVHMRISLPLDSVWIHDLWKDNEIYCWKKISGPDSYRIEYQFNTINLIRKLVPGNYIFLRIPVSYPGPSDSIMLEVVDDLNELNTIEYKNLSWQFYGASSSWGNSIVLHKVGWLDSRVINTKYTCRSVT